MATSSCLNPQLNSTRDSGSTGTNLDDSRLGQHMQTDGNTSDDMGYHESTPIKGIVFLLVLLTILLDTFSC